KFIIPIVTNYPMVLWSGSCKNRSMAGSCISWNIIEMGIFKVESPVYNSFKSVLFIFMPEPGEIIIPHLIYHNTHHQGRFLIGLNSHIFLGETLKYKKI